MRVILASGYSHPDSLPTGPNIAGFLHKPFRFDELMTAIRRALPQRLNGVFTPEPTRVVDSRGFCLRAGLQSSILIADSRA